jgi:eukaryotic-like serine/threonine-protein kinase
MLSVTPHAVSQSSGLKIVTIAPKSQTRAEVPASDSRPHFDSSLFPEMDDRDPTRPPPPPLVDPYLGCTIDNRYKVERLLGEGGMGMVYQCRHKIIDKRVALKILRSDLARDREVTERFLIEARAASSVGNEHIIDISDFGQLPDGSAYFVMEFLEGEPLSAAVGEGRPLPFPRLLNIGIQICVGLAAAHANGIVHRDLKPDNVYLVTRGQEADFVKILDFGIAKVSTGATGKLTQAGSVFGTPHYMSPEQAAGTQVDLRGDIYSVGVILYELASGQVPFDADNFMGILTQHMYKEPVPIRSLPTGAGISPGLEAIILKCLSKRPEQRYPNMDELRFELERLRHGTAPLAQLEAAPQWAGGQTIDPYYGSYPAREAPTPSMNSDYEEVSFRRGVNWPLYLAIAAPVVIAAIVLVVRGVGPLSRASELKSQAAAERAQKAAAQAAEAPAATAPALSDQVQIVVGIEPVEAHAFLGELDLGSSPVVVQLKSGAPAELEIRHKGYKTTTLLLDGSQVKTSVKLKRLPVKGGPNAGPDSPPAAPVSAKKKALGGKEIVNPWAQ